VNLFDVLTTLVLVAVGVRLVSSARLAVGRGGRDRVLAIARGLRPHHFLLAPFVFAVLVVAITLLLSVPGLDFGWWTAIGGIGNPVVGGSARTSGTAFEWLIPTVFFVLLLPALPLFAEAEERIFRWGSEHRSFWGRAWKGVQFGLIHALVGIPIGAALAISIAGWYFTWAYLRAYRRSGGDPHAGIAESTRSHVAYNLELVVLILAYFVSTALM
jgi:hypothetical protein